MSAPRPLEQIKRETKAADRSPHLRRNNRALPDQIDALDDVVPPGLGGVHVGGSGGGIPYHHEGPYDAALASRNRDPRTAPLAAVEGGNRAALRATPAANVADAVGHHVPLQGVASVPSGEADYAGNVMRYDEGDDLMREPDAPGGAYRRYQHVVGFFFFYSCSIYLYQCELNFDISSRIGAPVK